MESLSAASLANKKTLNRHSLTRSVCLHVYGGLQLYIARQRSQADYGFRKVLETAPSLDWVGDSIAEFVGADHSEMKTPKRLTRFKRIIRHDVNATLSAVSGCICEPKRVCELIDQLDLLPILEHSRNALLSALLVYEPWGSKVRDFMRRPTNLRQYLEGYTSIINRLWRNVYFNNADADCNVKYGQLDDVVTHCFPEDLAILAYNCIANAARFEASNCLISVEKKNGVGAKFTIEDDGLGLSEEFIADPVAIFKARNTSHATRKEDHGFGLRNFPKRCLRYQAAVSPAPNLHNGNPGTQIQFVAGQREHHIFSKRLEMFLETLSISQRIEGEILASRKDNEVMVPGLATTELARCLVGFMDLNDRPCTDVDQSNGTWELYFGGSNDIGVIRIEKTQRPQQERWHKVVVLAS